MSEFHAEVPQATVSEGLAHGRYVVARAGFEPNQPVSHLAPQIQGTHQLNCGPSVFLNLSSRGKLVFEEHKKMTHLKYRVHPRDTQVLQTARWYCGPLETLKS